MVLAVAGTALWGAATVGVARYAEDLCFDDLDGRLGYGAYRAESTLWPPAYRCQLFGNDVEPVVVEHGSVALARLGAAAVPLVVLLGAAAIGVADRSRPRPHR